MSEITLTVNNEVGLHARPAAQFVQMTKQFSSDIKVISGNREVNAKSMLGILGLGVSQGTVITIRAEGEDADQALTALAGLFEDNFGETE